MATADRHHGVVENEPVVFETKLYAVKNYNSINREYKTATVPNATHSVVSFDDLIVFLSTSCQVDNGQAILQPFNFVVEFIHTVGHHHIQM